MERKYGWLRQPPDDRDLKYSAARPLLGLPSSVDLRPNMPPIWDQGQLGSCTSFGIARAYNYAEIKAGLGSTEPSHLFIYYNERMEEGTVDTDAGAIIRDGIKSCNIYGVAAENMWPYDVSKFTVKPPEEAYDYALSNQIRFYASVDNTNINSVKLCMSHGWPIVFGFSVYPSFENYTGGVIEPPKPGDQYLGGHCVCTAGYDDSKQAILVANSWGPSFGDNGYFWLSYSYFTSGLVSDCWMMRLK